MGAAAVESQRQESIPSIRRTFFSTKRSRQKKASRSGNGTGRFSFR